MRVWLMGVVAVMGVACGDSAPEGTRDSGADTTPDTADTPDTNVPTDITPDTTDTSDTADTLASDTTDTPDTSAPDTTGDTNDTDSSGPPNVSRYLETTCPVVPGQLRVSTPGGSDLKLLTLSSPTAVCNDGSPAIAYVRAAADENRRNRWVFHLQGGGGCSNHEECKDRWCGDQGVYDAAKMSSRWARTQIGSPGLFKREAGNPPGQWNQVFVYYCTSDNWLGQETIDLVGENGDTYSLHARGHDILEGLLDALDAGAESDDGTVTLPRLTNAETILWTGASAGSVGATQHLDWVADRYQSAQVAGVFDAGFGPETDTFPQSVQEGTAARFEANWLTFQQPARSFFDTSCVAAYTEEPYRCAATNRVKRDHITTPFFQRLDLRDPTGSSGFISLGATLSQWSTAARDAMLALFDIDDTAAEEAAITRHPGVFAPSCAQHIGTMSDDWYDGATIGDGDGGLYTFKDVLLAWLEGTDVFLVDTVPASLSTCRATTDDR